MAQIFQCDRCKRMHTKDNVNSAYDATLIINLIDKPNHQQITKELCCECLNDLRFWLEPPRKMG